MPQPEAPGEAAGAGLGGAKEQNDTQRELREFQDRGKKCDVRQHEAFDQPGKDAARGARIRADELVEILNVARVGELVEARQNELDAERGLDEGRGSESGAPAGRKPA